MSRKKIDRTYKCNEMQVHDDDINEGSYGS